MRILAIDVGKKRSGIAYFDSAIGVPLALDTVVVEAEHELVAVIKKLVDERSIDRLIFGLPLLLSGEEGEQAQYVRTLADTCSTFVSINFIDERHTSHMQTEGDKDAAAACSILNMYLATEGLQS